MSILLTKAMHIMKKKTWIKAFVDNLLRRKLSVNRPSIQEMLAGIMCTEKRE